MDLVQILLPLADNRGRPFPDEVLRSIQRELSSRFGGLTAYERAPARGIWKQGGSHHREDVVVVEVMVHRVEEGWWESFRKRLESELAQTELVIRALPMRRI